jgi:hypothetical protein
LSEVTFIDAATIGMIVRTQEFLRFWQRALRMRAPSRCARRVLQLCDVADFFSLGRLEPWDSARWTTEMESWVSVPTAESLESLELDASPSSASGFRPALVQSMLPTDQATSTEF